MNAWRIALRLLRQDWRGGELYLLTAALVLTVAAITTVGFFTDRVEASMARQGSALLAADLALESSSPLPDAFAREASARGLAIAHTLEFRSVVMADQAPQLVRIKAVDPAYPLRGELRVADGFETLDRPVGGGPAPGEVWAESRLLRLLQSQVGDRIGVGESRLRIGAILTDEPDQGRQLLQHRPARHDESRRHGKHPPHRSGEPRHPPSTPRRHRDFRGRIQGLGEVTPPCQHRPERCP